MAILMIAARDCPNSTANSSTLSSNSGLMVKLICCLLPFITPFVFIFLESGAALIKSSAAFSDSDDFFMELANFVIVI